VSALIEIMDSTTGQWYPFQADSAVSDYGPLWNDIVDADRAVDGTLRYEGIAAKDKLTISWNHMPEITLQKLYQITSLKIFRVRYYSPMIGAFRTANFYFGSDLKVTANGQWSKDRFSGYKVSATMTEE